MMARREPAFADAALIERVRACVTCAAVLLAVLFALAQRTAHGADDPQCATPMARVASAQGAVEVRRAGSARWETVKLEDALCTGDMVRVGRSSRAAIALSNDISLRLDQRTTLTIAAPDEKRGSLLELCKGALHFITRYPKTFRVITPFVNAAVEGTEFYIGHGEAEDSLTVFEGRVVVTSEAARLTPQSCDTPAAPAAPGGSLTLAGGESAVVAAGQAPQKRLMARPQDAVQWALYYPPIIDSPPAEGSGATEWQTRWNDSRRLLQAGDTAHALSRISDVAGEAGDPRFFIYRAGLLLQVGRVDEANRDIERALQLGGRDSDANALKAIVRVSQNEKDQALALATQAAEQDPKSAAAEIALSYVRQAQFKLDEALAAAKQAAEVEPLSAIAWARVAELEMSLGNLDAALLAAQTANETNPRLARSQTILGFANLTRTETATAKTAFIEAIRLDSADPLPRLGLGLAKIREGLLEEGRQEIEIAVSLDPGNSLIRSYMGKAYYEEKRDELAGTQFDLARERDPHDPTPWFYDAIRKQAGNRPVDALNNLLRSIELNDNRAAFRSRQLLDQDLAARGVSLARIYSDLGFDRVGHAESAKALAFEPRNHSAHRFLADTYGTLPRHEIARVSELLQSQLRQPQNSTPVEPYLAAGRFGGTTVGFLRGIGPTSPGLSEYGRSFDRDGLGLYAEGLGGSQSTLGSRVVLSGLHDELSYSMGQYHFRTDGFGEQSSLRRLVRNAFLQMAFSEAFSVQGEVRSLQFDRFETLRAFDPVNALTTKLAEKATNRRLGARLNLGLDRDLIASVIWQDRNVDIEAEDLPRSRALESAGRTIELQYALNQPDYSIVAGVGRFDARNDFVAGGFSEIVSHRNAYAYGRVVMANRRLLLQAGAALDRYQVDDWTRDRASPKVGIIFTPVPETTIRAAFTRAMKRELLADQTVEPTQVAGFNQFFDDAAGTVSTRTGFAVDHRLGARVFAGVEATRRRLSIPVVRTDEEFSWRERTNRAYLYYALSRSAGELGIRPSGIAFTAEAEYDRLERPDEATDEQGVRLLRAWVVPIGARLFAESGFTFRVTATLLRQHVEFRSFVFSDPIESRERAWVGDVSISHVLPKRRGGFSIGVRNVFDRRLSFVETDPANPRFPPERFLFAQIVLSI